MNNLTTARVPRRGFTLIELLVVIAIIAILAAILFPVFAQAKLAAKKTADLSNIKQISIAVPMYLGDSDDVYPIIRSGFPNYGCGNNNPGSCFQIQSGHAVVSPYIKNKDVWKSPNDTMTRCDNSGANGCTASATGGPVSYIFSYNGQQNVLRDDSNLSTTDKVGFGISGYARAYADGSLYNRTNGSLNGSQVGSPAATVYILPMYISWTYYSGLMQYRADQRMYAFKELGVPTWPNIASAAGAWCCSTDALSMGAYGNQSNFGFADGHAKTMPREALMDRLWYTNIDQAIANKAKNLIHVNEAYK